MTDSNSDLTLSVQQIEAKYSNKPLVTPEALANFRNRRYSDDVTYTPEQLPKYAAVNPEGKIEIKKEAPRIMTAEALNKYIEFHMEKDLANQGRKMVLTPANANILTSICTRYIRHHEGVYLMGDHSGGKTFVMKHFVAAVNLAHRHGFDCNRMITIDYQALFNSCVEKKGLEPLFRIKQIISDTECDIYVDDLAYHGNNEVNLMGTKIEVIQQVVSVCHTFYEKGHKVYMSSNIHPDVIKDAVSEGCQHRLLQMCYPMEWERVGDGFRLFK